MTVAERLRAERGDKPREEVAEAVGISVSALGMYEQGNRVPRDSIKLRLADYYGCTVQQLFF
jgi:transcriptional regulator with XRE-family HTH domain